ncbi:MAG TPA: LuxR C-terminal-related transcriptional regulator [Kineosporiaceae bacterium]|nr:LuxR C-terminal-related transcriptional regulator [Kineosporiaceae bacterium]
MTRARRPEGNLPVPVTRFVGRRQEIAVLRRALQDARLVTLTGVGGVGKTRLALEVARAVQRAFPGGAWMVDLSTVVEGGQVPQAVATALGVLDRSTRPPVDSVAELLHDSEALIVLDNCEHLIDGCARFVADLLSRTVQVKVLATSRQTLGIAGEHLFAVPPLAVPDEAGMASTEAIGASDAVQLLLDRARALQPGFALTEANRVAVARLCARLDGLPLAIELAATRMRSLSLEQLLDRIEGRFALLTGGSRVAGARQQTLRAVIDWSHSLCSPAERLLWARLSVFTGGFDLEAAERVCSGDGLPAPDVLDLLDRLVAQSIVLSDTGPDGLRFRLLETIRQYGRERLAELGEEAQLLRRHRDHFLALARAAAAQWCSPRQQAALARLRTEHGNLRAALEAAMIDPDGPQTALALAGALRQHWYADAFLGEGRRWLDQALALPDPAAAPARTEALWVAAWVSLLQGDLQAGRLRLSEAGERARDTGDERSLGFVHTLNGTALLFQGRLPEAEAEFSRGLAVFERIGDTEGSLWVMFQLAITLAHGGSSSRAQEIGGQALELSQATGERLCRAYTLWVLGFDCWRQGDLDAADRYAREALELERLFNDPVGAGLVIELVAWIAGSRGDLPTAARTLATADSVWSLIGTTLAAFGPPLRTHRDACERLLAERLDPEAARQARERGRQVSVESAVAAVLDRDGGAGSHADSPGRRPGPLTSREEEVAALMAQGLSNRAIAGQLVISQRTVDGHVERILAKLGFTARTQVAAWVAGREAHSGR